MSTCSYSLDDQSLPPCIVPKINKYKNLLSFITGKAQSAKLDSVPVNLGCIKLDLPNKSISLEIDRCINCFACVFTCPGSKLNFTEEHVPTASCSDYLHRSSDEKDRIKQSQILFNSQQKHFPLKSKYESFEDFSGIDETKNISVWAATTLKFIFGEDSIVGTEIPMAIKQRDRDGRLDIGVLAGNHLLVAESKISLRKMLAEGRYISQLIAYEEELSTLDSIKHRKIIAKKFLLIGGDETDLLPPTHNLCTAKVGNNAEIFYDAVLKNNFVFVSARGLLALASAESISSSFNASSKFIELLFNPSTIGILSNTVIKKTANEITVEEIGLMDL